MSKNLSDIILESLRDGVLIVDRSGTIVYCNKAAEDLFGKPTTELLRQPFGFPITPAEIQEIEIVKSSNVAVVQMIATDIHWNGEDGHLLSLRDITELKRISKELELHKLRLEKSNRDLEQYAFLASHDLQEPIRKIMLYSDRMLQSESVQALPAVKGQIERVLHCGKRMQSLIIGIVDYSRLSTSDQAMGQVNVNEIIRGVLSDLDELIAEKNVSVDVDNFPAIRANSIQIRQLFFNLISNAIKYSKEDVPPYIRITCTDRDSHIEVRVADNGIGFEPQYAGKIFQLFQRLHSQEYEGSGIGLAMCKAIVEGHGGTITVKSIPRQGTEFIFSLAKDPLLDSES
jgi:two-component system, LuxR family, sensor kinase FixL